MKKGVRLHVESLSLVDFVRHTKECFVSYASANGYKLGAIGDNYVVLKYNDTLYSSTNAQNALDFYSEILKQS